MSKFNHIVAPLLKPPAKIGEKKETAMASWVGKGPYKTQVNLVSTLNNMKGFEFQEQLISWISCKVVGWKGPSI